MKKLRLSTGLSQRAFAQRAQTSQPAIARYESGVATPSWQTLERLAEVSGRRVEINVMAIPEPHDIELAQTLLALTPLERLRTLARYARLRELADLR
ncbi:MAG TPA: helix-turn-helix transcriptional regulator [Solirubrobacterales bacterium]